MSETIFNLLRRLLIFLQIITPVFFISFSYKKRKYFILRTIICFILSLTYVILVPILTSSNPYLKLLFESIYYFIFFVICNVIVFAIYDIPFRQSVVITIIAYDVQHLCYLVFNIIDTIIFSNITVTEFLSYIFVRRIIITTIPLYLISYLLGKKIKENPNILLPSSSIFAIALISVISDIIISNTDMDNTLINPLWVNMSFYAMRLFNILVCILILVIIFSKVDQEKTQHELEIISQLNNERSRQYQINKETIDLINLKVHDLKHQIRNLTDGNKAISTDVVNEINKTLNIYDTNIKTGRDALNIILQEKALICKNKNISFECMIDGSSLNNITDSDLYSLIGNILDNAIEGCNGYPKPYISLKIKNIGMMAFIYEENTTLNNLKIVDGFPVTTKEDNNYHGFGVKSIRYIAEKYDGALKLSCKDNYFSLIVSLNNNIK